MVMSRKSKLTVSRFFLESLNSTSSIKSIKNIDDHLRKELVQESSRNTINNLNPLIGFTQEEIENAKLSVIKIKYSIRCLNLPNKHSKIYKYKQNTNISNKKRLMLGFTELEKSISVIKKSQTTNICNNLENQISDTIIKSQHVTSKYWNLKNTNQFKGFTEEEKKSSFKTCEKFNRTLNVTQFTPIRITRNSKTLLRKTENNSIPKDTITPRLQKNTVKSTFKEFNNNVCSKYFNCQNSELHIKLERYDFLYNNISRSAKRQSKISNDKLPSSKTKDIFKSLKKETDQEYSVRPNKMQTNDNFKKPIKTDVVTSFIPPVSPHNLIEEQLYHNPWALLIATIFLNKTSCQIARPYVFWFLHDNPDPLTVLKKNVGDLEIYFRALGLQTTRAKQVWRMSHDYMYKNWKRVGELYGVGRYGEEAFRMFCLGDFSVEPKDRYLKIYKAWYEMTEKNTRIKEMNS